MGGGFNERYHKVIQTESLQAAGNISYDMACEIYDDYAGMHGILSFDEIAEENNLDPIDDSDVINEIYCEEREGWVNYWAEPYTNKLAKSLEYRHYENPYEDTPDFLIKYGELLH